MKKNEWNSSLARLPEGFGFLTVKIGFNYINYAGLGQLESQPSLMESCGKGRLDIRNQVMAFIALYLKNC